MALSDNPMIRAGIAMANGDFDEARELLNDISKIDEQSKAPALLNNLLSQFEKLTNELDQAREEAWQGHVDEMMNNYHLAQWRESLLESSRKFSLDQEEKKQFEQELQDKIQENWLDALAELAAAIRLAERMKLDDTINKSIKSRIISETQILAKSIEKEENPLKAYNKVYYYLTVVDEDQFDFDEMHSRLLREETLRAVYVLDPNSEGIDWQERREGITAEMITTALAIINLNYVASPDYVKMGEDAVENCLLLAETDKIREVFNSLNDEQARDNYISEVKTLWKKYRPVIEETDDFRYLYFLMEGIVQINDKYLGLDDEIVLAEFAEGAFSALDSYTYLVWPGDVKDFNKSMTNEFSGIGVVIRKQVDARNPEYNNVLRVDSLVSYEGGAYEAGMDAGDLILEVEGNDIRNYTLEKAVRLITGPAGTKVNLTVYREGFEEPRQFEVTRNHVVVPTVKGLYYDRKGAWEHFLDPDSGIAYVRLTHFSAETPGSLRNKLRGLQSRDMRALILDLRSNSGGYLSGAVDIVDTFIDEGAIVSSRYRNPDTEQVRKASSVTTFDSGLPMVVLVNSASASASEIVAGALKDHQRATIIGTRTFGKGNVQTIQRLLPTDAQLKMTVAYYYLPSGRRVHRDPDNKKQEDYGVMPHIEVELTADQIEDYVGTWHDADVLHRNDLGEQEQAWELMTREKLLEKDPQLYMALLNLRARLWVADNVTETYLAGSHSRAEPATATAANDSF